MKPFVSAVRNKGIRLVIYLDDIAIISSSRELSFEETAFVIQMLESLGFIVNKEKSMLVLLQSVEFLGFIVDSVEMIASLPERKINQLREQSASLWEKPSVLFES